VNARSAAAERVAGAAAVAFVLSNCS